MFHPTRGGTRGGKDQFSWEDVKQDKHRENYLGHSLMAPVGRWQKGKDLQWYAKKGSEEERAKANASELSKIKEAEAEAMAIALGVRKKKTLESKVTEEELKYALKNDNDDSEDEQMKIVDSSEKGLGYGRSSRFNLPSANNVEVMNAGEKSVSEQFYSARRGSLDSEVQQETIDKEEKHRKKKKSKKHHKHKSEKKRHHYSDDNEDDYKRTHSHRHDRKSPVSIRREPREDEERYSRSRRHEKHPRDEEERHSRSRRDDRYHNEERNDHRHRYKESRERRSDSPYERNSRSQREYSPKDKRNRSRSLERSLSPYSKRKRI